MTQTPATERQVAFINKLVVERGYQGSQDWAKLSKADASATIQMLLDLPKPAPKAPAKVAETDVPEGRYAIEIGGHLHFFRIDRPSDGKWAGWTFVKRQSGDNYDRIRGAEAEQVLSLIAKDADEALRRYGRELGVCGVCGRTLTDDESRSRGIGPECNKRREIAA